LISSDLITTVNSFGSCLPFQSTKPVVLVKY